MPDKNRNFNDAYLKGLSPADKAKRKKELERGEQTDTDDPAAYDPSRFKTDKTASGKSRKTKPSKWTEKFKKMYGENHELEFDEGSVLYEELDVETIEILKEFIEQIVLAEKGDKVTKALKNKAEKTGAPLGALRAIYNKGLAAWRTGHRPGASQHQWAMARVNSVLAGGPARKVDSAQWDKIKKHRGKKRKK